MRFDLLHLVHYRVDCQACTLGQRRLEIQTAGKEIDMNNLTGKAAIVPGASMGGSH